MSYALGLLGAGNMAEAIVRGLLRGDRISKGQILVSDPSADRRAFFQDELGVAATQDNDAVAKAVPTLVLSVKPQVCGDVLGGIARWLDPDVLVVSIMAGISAQYIQQALGGKRRVVRTMPNTPMLVGEGMVAVARGSFATAADIMTATNLFSAAADVMEVTEDQIDAVTAVSGSGPAYFFYLVEAMTAAGVQLGLTEDQALRLATRTAVGAGHMMVATAAESPAELRRRVTSPNGTTQAAIAHMAAAGFPKIVADAMAAAEKRSRELGR
jgi:pyrroline-5-carboxylate reductase